MATHPDHASPPSDVQRKKRSLGRRLLLLLVAPLCLILAGGAGAAYYLCMYKPELVAAVVQEQLCALTGLPWRIQGRVMPTFVPALGVTATEVSILAATEEQSPLAPPGQPLVYTQEVKLTLDLEASIADRTARFTAIDLIAPRISLTYDRNGQPLWLPPAGEGASSAIFSFFSGEPQLESEPGRDEAAVAVPAVPEGDKADAVYALACHLRDVSHSALIPLRIRNGSLVSYDRGGSPLLSFSAIEGALNPDNSDEHLRFSALFAVPDADLEITFSVGARLCERPVLLGGTLEGTVRMTPPGSRAITGEFSSTFNWQDGGKDVQLPDFTLRAEGDGLSGDLAFNLDRLALTGPVHIDRISLPRWFVFGRRVPPGLSEALHTVTGDFDLYFDAATAQARNLRCRAGREDMLLEGRGYVGTESFSAPVVKVDVTLDTAAVDPVFPFLAAVGRYVPKPEPPVFDHPPLAPYPKHPDAAPSGSEEGGVNVGYDIRIHVLAPKLHNVTGGPATVLVFPIVKDGEEMPRVAIEATNLLKGNVKGELDVADAGIFMRYQASNMDVGLLPENSGHAAEMAGRVSGTCEIDIPVDAEGNVGDDWNMRVDVSVQNCAVRESRAKRPWFLSSGTTRLRGTSVIHAVLEEGVRIEGSWNMGAQAVKSSWHPQGKDALAGVFKGGFFWPPILEQPAPEPGKKRRIERKAVRRIAGALQVEGGLIVPLASGLHPIKGVVSTTLEWDVPNDKVTFSKNLFKGFGSIAEGNLKLDMSGKKGVFTSDATFKINPREVLRQWQVSVSDAIQVPGLLTGRADISGSVGEVRFDKLKIEVDGAPVTGTVTWKERASDSGQSPGHWTVRLSAQHFDFDNLFPPEAAGAVRRPKSREPWNMTFLRGLSVDAQVFLNSSKRQGLTFSRTKVTATLDRERFSLHSESENFYDGTATFVLQGTFVPEQSQILLRKALSQMNNISLGKALYDFAQSTSYAGTADVVFDVKGVLTCDADIPSKLSGIWSLHMKDGLYPSILSNQKSNSRNTFSAASASGLLDKGVLRWNNFALRGPLVDMSGKGWYNLDLTDFDIEVSVTFAKVPTVPVRFYGTADKPHMKVRGVDMVLETVQAAGGTVFSLVIGVLELPGNAISGIISIFGDDESEE